VTTDTLSPYTFGLRIPHPIASVRPRLEAELKAEGFGILTEIDVQATLRAKLDVAWPPHVILGACNPRLAHRALEAEPAVGALLPCNVVLREEGGETIVEAMDPQAALAVADNPAIRPVAAEARERLERALGALAAA